MNLYSVLIDFHDQYLNIFFLNNGIVFVVHEYVATYKQFTGLLILLFVLEIFGTQFRTYL